MPRCPADVIFINNGSTDASAEVLVRLAENTQVPIQVIYFRCLVAKRKHSQRGFKKPLATSGSREKRMKPLRQYIGLLIAGLLMFFIIRNFVQTHNPLKDGAFQIHCGWLFCSFGVLLFYRSVYTAPFATLLSVITQKNVSFRDAFTLFHLANITRYLPGRIWGVVRLLTLSRRFGLSKTNTASSLTLHVGIETALGGFIAMILLFSKQMRQTVIDVLETFSAHTLLLTIAVMGIMASLVFLIPKLAHHAREFLKTLTPLLKTSRVWGTVLTAHSLLWLCQGLAFFLFVRSLAPMPWAGAGVLTASYAFAWIVGFLSFLTPSGLGIREGLLGLLLANYMPTSKATLVALLCRLWMFSVEILLAGTAFLLHRKRKTQCQETI